MNFNYSDKINPFLEKLNFNEAIKIAEQELQKIPDTTFHSVIGLNFNSHIDPLLNWINDFYEALSKKFEIKAMYFEMNEFDINTDVWYILGYAYPDDGGFNSDDMEWLCDVTIETMTNEAFVLQGFEKLQKAFENENSDNEDLQNARDWCEQIIIARFMELMHVTHLKSKEQKLPWAKTPVYFTEHSYDFIVKSKK